MTEEPLDRTLKELLRELGPAPEPPREEMWRVIRERRAPVPARRRRFAWPLLLRWAPAAGVALVGGILLVRSLGPADPGAVTPVASTAPDVAPDPTLPDPYTLAALRHFGSAEALLVGFPQDAREGRTEEVARWAGDLLTDTRLFADSPAGDDPELARLLADLELVLAQIAALRGDRASDVRFVQDGIDRTDVLLRLRIATGDAVAAGL